MIIYNQQRKTKQSTERMVQKMTTYTTLNYDFSILTDGTLVINLSDYKVWNNHDNHFSRIFHHKEFIGGKGTKFFTQEIKSIMHNKWHSFTQENY